MKTFFGTHTFTTCMPEVTTRGPCNSNIGRKKKAFEIRQKNLKRKNATIWNAV